METNHKCIKRFQRHYEEVTKLKVFSFLQYEREIMTKISMEHKLDLFGVKRLNNDRF